MLLVKRENNINPESELQAKRTVSEIAKREEILTGREAATFKFTEAGLCGDLGGDRASPAL